MRNTEQSTPMTQELRDQIRDALMGDSNDAEHDALTLAERWEALLNQRAKDLMTLRDAQGKPILVVEMKIGES